MDVSAMLSALSDHGFDDASDARLIEKLNTAYYDLCSRQPWPFLETSVVLTFAGGVSTATNWPTDFRAADILVTTAGNETGVRLKSIRYSDFLTRFGSTDLVTQTGTPAYFYFVGTVPHFYPVPPSNTQITMQYICVPAALADATAEASILVPKEFHSVIVDGALFKLYAMEDDTDIAPTFETYFERGIQNMTQQAWKRDYSTQDIVQPTDYDDLNVDRSGGGWAV